MRSATLRTQGCAADLTEASRLSPLSLHASHCGPLTAVTIGRTPIPIKTQVGIEAKADRARQEIMAVRRIGARAERAALMYTLIQTAKLSNVDPQAWLADVLARIANTPQTKLAELLPWNWHGEFSRQEAA